MGPSVEPHGMGFAPSSPGVPENRRRADATACFDRLSMRVLGGEAAPSPLILSLSKDRVVDTRTEPVR